MLLLEVAAGLPDADPAELAESVSADVDDEPEEEAAESWRVRSHERV